MKRYTLITLIFILFISGMFATEIRSLWVLPWSINTPESIDKMISDAVRNNQTEILIEVRYRADALYTQNRVPDIYLNPEPRSYILSLPDFDPLAYAISEGHKHGLKVQAWAVVFNATPLDSNLIRKNYMFTEHPDWITYDANYLRMKSTEQFGYFIDPGIPEVQEHLLNVFGDLASGYPDLDGIHLDYIRYPSTDFGYHPVSIGRFQHQKEVEPDLEWNAWRIRQVSTFVENLYKQTKSLAPNMLLTAAVFADQFEAVGQYAQDWQSWLDKKIIDRVYLMHYHKDDSRFLNILSNVKDMDHDDRIVVGLRAWDPSGASLLPNIFSESRDYNVYNLIDRINWVRDYRFAGLALFSYDGIVKGGALDYLGRQVFLNEPLVSVVDPLNNAIPGSADQTATDLNPDGNIAPDVVVMPNLDSYLLYLYIPHEGTWKLALFDEDDNLILERTRYFQNGSNTEFWDGTRMDGSKIDTGIYYFRLGRDDDACDYLIPVDISRIW